MKKKKDVIKIKTKEEELLIIKEKKGVTMKLYPLKVEEEYSR